MRTFCWLAQLPESEPTWGLSQRLFLYLNLIPEAIALALGVLLSNSGRPVGWRIGSLAILLAIVALIGLSHSTTVPV
jgi:hypothetical protein